MRGEGGSMSGMAQWHSHAHNRRFGLNENKYYGEQLSNWKEPGRLWETQGGEMGWDGEESKRDAEGAGERGRAREVEGEQEKRWLIDDFAFEILKMVSAFFEYLLLFFVRSHLSKTRSNLFLSARLIKINFFMFRGEAAENYRCDYTKRLLQKFLGIFFFRRC